MIENIQVEIHDIGNPAVRLVEITYQGKSAAHVMPWPFEGDGPEIAKDFMLGTIALTAIMQPCHVWAEDLHDLGLDPQVISKELSAKQ